MNNRNDRKNNAEFPLPFLAFMFGVNGGFANNGMNQGGFIPPALIFDDENEKPLD